MVVKLLFKVVNYQVVDSYPFRPIYSSLFTITVASIITVHKKSEEKYRK